MPSAFDSIADIWIWWCAELRDLFRPAESERTETPRLQLNRAGAVAVFRGSNDAIPLSPAETLTTLDSRSEWTLELSSERGLIRRLSDQRIPYHQALEMAAIDLAEETPFSPEAVYLAIERPSANDHGTRYLMIRRDQIDPIFESLTAAKVRVRGIIVGHAAGSPFNVSKRCLRRIAPKLIRPRFGRSPSWAFSIAAVILTAAALGQLNYRYYAASETIDEQVQSLQQRATIIRKRLDRQADDQAALMAAQSTKAQAVSVTRLWGRLTEVLPQTTWLNEFALQNTTVSIDGYSGDAAGLIWLLDETAKFSATRFTSPVVHTPGVDGDHFSIQTNAAL